MPAERYAGLNRPAGIPRERCVYSLTTPPERLAERLGSTPPGQIFDLLNPDNTLSERVTAIQGMALAIRGEIEGIGPKNGRILRFRLLPERLRPEKPADDEVYASASTVRTRANIGVYRQMLAGGQLCWALSLLRTAGL